MAAIGDPSDKVAGLDQFQPTLTKRGGKGSVVFEGVTYSRMAWIRRSARLGHTLAAGEGQLLEAEVTRLEGLVEAAYREGWYDRDDRRDVGEDVGETIDRRVEDWSRSDAAQALEGEA